MQRTKVTLATITGISLAYSFLLFFRWKLTGLTPVATFGRIWQYYVSWADFGFHRRGLLGTILSVTGLNRITDNPYQFVYMFYSAILLLAYFLLVKLILSHEKLRANPLLAACILLSPATFAHWAYGTGNMDALLCVLLLLAVFYVRRVWILALLLFCGVLVHELFVFFMPGIFLLKFLQQPEGARRLDKRLIIPACAAAVALALVVLAGQLNVSEATYNAAMAQRIPMAVRSIPLWSGYFEVASSTQRNFGPTFGYWWAARDYILLPTLYALLVAGGVARYARVPVPTRLALLAAILAPVLATLIAWDYYRWLCLSVWMGFACMLFLIIAGKLEMPKRFLALLLLFTLLSPFGPDVLRSPFPVQQTIWAKLVR